MKYTRRFLSFVLAAAMLLPLASCGSISDLIFPPDEPDDTEKLPYDGHYLIDLYDPYDGTRDYFDEEKQSSAIYEVETLEMAHETFNKGIHFGSAYKQKDLYLDYDIGGKYENISFFYGMDISVRWGCDFNVSFQVINAETNKIIWEDLFVAGDIPRFVTVNIKGVEKLRLECYNLDGDTFCMGDITLWEGESEAADRTYPKITEKTMLKDNYRFFHSLKTFTMATMWEEYRNFSGEYDKLSIKGRKFDHAALLTFNDDLVMNLRGQFKQISFTWGLSDDQTTVSDGFLGYMSIYADGVCVLDEFVCTVDTPEQTIILDVNYARQLRFVLRSDNISFANFVLAELAGGENLGEAAKVESDGNTPVPLVQTHYPHFTSGTGMGTYVKIYDSSSRYHGFYMGGEKFIEGIVLAPMWNLFSEKANPAYAVSDLEGKYKYITFTAGHIDDAAYKPAVLEIYLDGEEEPSYTFEINDTAMPKEYTIDVRNCRSIKFLCDGGAESNLPLIGIANIVCYPEEVVENDVFEPFYKDYPEQCDLFEYFQPFGWASYNIDKIYYDDGIYADGKYFETFDGVRHKKGLLFCTHTGADWDHFGFFNMAICFWCPIGAIEEIGSVGAQLKNSFFMFNVGGQYDTLTFSTAKAVGSNKGEFSMLLGDPPQEGRQFITIFGDSDDEPLYEVELIDGTVQEHTVDISGVTRLVFCVANNGTIMSEVYSAYDIELSKNAD